MHNFGVGGEWGGQGGAGRVWECFGGFGSVWEGQSGFFPGSKGLVLQAYEG